MCIGFRSSCKSNDIQSYPWHDHCKRKALWIARAVITIIRQADCIVCEYHVLIYHLCRRTVGVICAFSRWYRRDALWCPNVHDCIEVTRLWPDHTENCVIDCEQARICQSKHILNERRSARWGKSQYFTHISTTTVSTFTHLHGTHLRVT